VKYQVRDARFGLALADGKNAIEALTDFLYVRERADVRAAIKVVHVEDDGTVAVNYRGLRLYAVPTDRASY
jgi:hypothetical protein